MIKKYLEFITESNYDETSWSNDDVTITIGDIEDYLKDEKVIEIPVSEIAEMCIHKDKTDDTTKKRAAGSDLKYPIIITTVNGEYDMILDGHHRLQKAINTNEQTIKAKVLNMDDAPDHYKILFG